MDKALKSFLSGIVDYAGLFPPASLSLKTAMEEYVKYRHSDYDWMLSRFIITTAQFDNLRNLSLKDHQLPDPLRLSVTTKGTKSETDFLSMMESICSDTIQLHKEIPELIQTQLLEIKLPESILSQWNAEEMYNIIDHSVHMVSKHPLLPHNIFFEVPGFEFDAELAKKVIHAISEHNKTVEQDDLEQYKFSGFKIRCGGVEAFQFPPAEYLAETIINARDAGVPLKFTAGLHHPVRLFHSSVQTKMFGFLNVFGAGILAYAHDLSTQKIQEILEDEESGHFSFSGNDFSWKDLSVSFSEIQTLRKEALISFGSCSMAEPVEDLQDLGLIE